MKKNIKIFTLLLIVLIILINSTGCYKSADTDKIVNSTTTFNKTTKDDNTTQTKENTGTTHSTTKNTQSTTKTTSTTSTQINKVPYYDQTKYKNIAYGDYGTVSSHGCAIVCISMIASYTKGDGYTPDILAKQFGSYNTSVGSLRSIFPDSAKQLDLEYYGITSDKEKVIQALKDGHLVISGQKNSVFSETGHFILLTGIDENGNIMVNDPFGPNYVKNDYMKEHFKIGFPQDDVFGEDLSYWIY